MTVYPMCKMNSIVPTLNLYLKVEIDCLKLFTKSSFQSKSNEFIQHYTDLPNFKVVKTIFDLVVLFIQGFAESLQHASTKS